jgi:hypothetical protein
MSYATMPKSLKTTSRLFWLLSNAKSGINVADLSWEVKNDAFYSSVKHGFIKVTKAGKISLTSAGKKLLSSAR